MKTRGFNAILLFVALVAGGWACEVGFSTARIADAKLTKDVSSSSEVVNPTSTFDSTDQIIHCVVRLANAPNDTKVRARWIAVKAQGVEENKQLEEGTITADGTNNIAHFTLELTSGKFPVGEYRVDLYLNPKTDKESPPDKTLTFTVKSSDSARAKSSASNETADSETASEDATARIADAKLSKEVNRWSMAVNPTSTFDQSDPIIHCVVELANAPDDTKVRARWILVKAEGYKENNKISEYDLIVDSSKNVLDFTLKPSGGPLPAGDYRVDLYLNPGTDKESSPDKTLTFRVKSSDSARAKSSASSETADSEAAKETMNSDEVK